MATGWEKLGYYLAGGHKRDDSVYRRRLQENEALAKLMEERQARNSLGDVLAGSGIAPEQAQMMRAAAMMGIDPRQFTGARGDFEEQSRRQRAEDAALRMYGPDNPNAPLFGLASAPQQLGTIVGGEMLANRFAPGGGYAGPTAVGQSSIDLRGAQAQQAFTGAQENLAQAALYQAKRDDPQRFLKGSTQQGAGVGLAFTATDPDTGRSITATTIAPGLYQDASGAVKPIPAGAVFATAARSFPVAQAEGIRRDKTAEALALSDDVLASRYMQDNPLTEKARAASGPIDRLTATAPFEFLFGASEAGRATTDLQYVERDAARILSNNPRFPGWEQKLISGLTPSPTVIGEEGEVRKSEKLYEYLVEAINYGRERMQRAATAKEATQYAEDVSSLSNIMRRIHAMDEGAPLGQQAVMPSQGVTRIQSDAEFDRLPSGTMFVGPDGKTRRKP